MLTFSVLLDSIKMSSSGQSSSSLPVCNWTAPLLDFDLQEEFLLPLATELNSKNIDTLMQKLSENETQNTNLRRKILEKEKHVEELSSRLQLEKANVQKEDNLSRSVKAVQAHLQCQIQIKEVENNKLKMKIQITSLLEDQKRREEWKRNSDEEILEKLGSVNSKNEKINLENEKLKASVTTLKSSTVSVENELLDLQEQAKLQGDLVEQYRNQVQKLQIAVEELKSRYERILNENKRITENNCLEVDEEEHSITSLGSHSLEKENHNIQKKYEDLKRQLEKMELQNEELACQLKKEDDSLQCSKLQLEEKIAEYNRLARQLESALEEGKKMVAEELEKISYKEQALQAKMFALETEVREGQEEKNQLLCTFHHNEKHHEVHLKELENSLRKSENKNQSIQNYVQFLKASYITMFGSIL
ncbi:protein BCAP isoform X6 [Patagioenas fasciata]|uniref:protein BCAP isoform X6 n=1 Tax=Patagioenas fasciata TaxID=372321 RepID=UPI003A9958D9